MQISEVLLVAFRTGVDVSNNLAVVLVLAELRLDGTRKPIILGLQVRERVDEHELRVCPPDGGGQATLDFQPLTRVNALAFLVWDQVGPFRPLG